jgi:hypothetical protein
MNDILSMWGISNQRPSRGSIGVAHTAFSRTGQAEAARFLAEETFQLLHARASDRGYEQRADDLAPANLTSAVSIKVATLPLLQGAPPTADELEERRRLLTDLQAGNLTSACRQIMHAIDQVVAERLSKLRQAVAATFDSNPADIGKAVVHVRDALRAAVWPTEGSKALERLAMLVQKLRELPEFEGRLIPQAASRVATYLVEQGRAAAAQALD